MNFSTRFIDLSYQKLNDERRPFLQKILIKNLLDLSTEPMVLRKNEKKIPIYNVNNSDLESDSDDDDNIPLFYVQKKLLNSSTCSIQNQNCIDQSHFRHVILKSISSHQNYLLF